MQNDPVAQLTLIDALVLLPGIIILTGWIFKTSIGKKALSDAPPRPNKMPLLLPFIPFAIWIITTSLAVTLIDKYLENLPDWQSALADNIIISTAAIGTMIYILILAKKYFTNKLNGFGLNTKNIIKDLGLAFINLLATAPVVILAIVLTVVVGKLIVGPDFQIQQHAELEALLSFPQISLKILIVITAIVIVPVFEEILFRGLFQTVFRSYFARPWPAVFLSAALFATVHANPQHWPALFVLSVALGYAYEKSGSLFRSIFMHAIFNAVSITAALYQ